MLLSGTMPIIRAAEKRMRADRKRHFRNIRIQSELKTLTQRFQKLSQGGKADEIRNIFALLVKRLDQAASKGILHKNTASRTKGRLARRLNKLKA